MSDAQNYLLPEYPLSLKIEPGLPEEPDFLNDDCHTQQALAESLLASSLTPADQPTIENEPPESLADSITSSDAQSNETVTIKPKKEPGVGSPLLWVDEKNIPEESSPKESTTSSTSSSSSLSCEDSGFSDLEEEGTKKEIIALKTKNEVEPAPPPVLITPSETAQIEFFGKVFGKPTEQSVVIQHCTGATLDLESLLCARDRTLIGPVYETFGPVERPFYSVLEPKHVPTEGDDVFYFLDHSNVVDPALIYTPGTDASNIWDEELPEDVRNKGPILISQEQQLEFSDDEAEQAAKNAKPRGNSTDSADSTGVKRGRKRKKKNEKEGQQYEEGNEATEPQTKAQKTNSSQRQPNQQSPTTPPPFIPSSGGLAAQFYSQQLHQPIPQNFQAPQSFSSQTQPQIFSPAQSPIHPSQPQYPQSPQYFQPPQYYQPPQYPQTQPQYFQPPQYPQMPQSPHPQQYNSAQLHAQQFGQMMHAQQYGAPAYPQMGWQPPQLASPAQSSSPWPQQPLNPHSAHPGQGFPPVLSQLNQLTK